MLEDEISKQALDYRSLAVNEFVQIRSFTVYAYCRARFSTATKFNCNSILILCLIA